MEESPKVPERPRVIEIQEQVEKLSISEPADSNNKQVENSAPVPPTHAQTESSSSTSEIKDLETKREETISSTPVIASTPEVTQDKAEQESQPHTEEKPNSDSKEENGNLSSYEFLQAANSNNGSIDTSRVLDIGVSSNRGRRKKNEDAHTVDCKFKFI